MTTFSLDIQYRFEAEDRDDAIRKARALGFLDESDEVQIRQWRIRRRESNPK